MSQGKSPDEGHNRYVVRVATDEDTMVEPAVLDLAPRVRKLEIETHDEIYYPAVSFMHTKAAEMAEGIEVKFQKSAEMEPKVAEPAALAETVEKAKESKHKRQSMKKWRSRLGTLVVVTVATVAVVLVGLRLAGFRTFTVMSGSMAPEYPVGAMIYVKPVDYYSLQVGDTISYVANDEKTVVTHRIVEIEVDEKDASVWRFKTKGDANATADTGLVHYKNVLGTPVVTIPYIGYFAHNIQQPPGVYIALVVGTLLLAWTFLPGTLEERRKTARKSVA